MTERTIRVSLTAQVSGYLAGLEQARRKTQDVQKASGDLRAQLDEQNRAMTEVGAGLMAMGALAAVGVGLAIKKFADFDQAMSNVEAATHETAADMELLRDAALDAGARTVFSATEAANAVEELGKAGLSTSDILNGALDGALSLAAAGGLGVAEAAGIASVALKTFKLDGSQASHVADVLAAGAGKAMGDVTDLGAALSQTGQVAAGTGLSIEETTGALAAFASNGLLGSDAGTSFKSMLQRLTPQSAEASKRMEELNISAYDAQGNFIGLQKFAGVLKDGLKGLTTEQRNSALGTIFGSDAVRAATVLYSEGAKGIGEWTDAVNDQGYAADTAAARLDNLKGDVEALGGSFDTALIKSGSAADGALRLLVQTATNLVNIFNEAPPILQQATLGLGALVAVTALTGGTFLVAIPKIAAFKLALDTLAASTMPSVAAAATGVQTAMARTGTALAATGKFLAGPWGLALAAAGVSVGLLTQYLDSLKASSAELTNSLKSATSAQELFAKAAQGAPVETYDLSLKDLRRDLELLADAQSDTWAQFGGEFQDANIPRLQTILQGLGKELAALAQSDLPSAQKAFRKLAAETDGSAKAQLAIINASPEYRDALIAQADALGLNVTSSNEAANNATLLKIALGETKPKALDAADAYLKASDATAGLEEKLRTLLDTINEANGVGQDAVSTNIAYQDSLAKVDEFIQKAREGVEGYALGLDQSTQSGRDNLGMLNELAGNYQTAAEAQFALDGNTQTYVANLEAGRDAVLQRAEDLGATDEQVQFLRDHIVNLPTEKQIKIIAETSEAQQRMERVSQLLDKFKDSKTKFGWVGRVSAEGFAHGGTIPGTPSLRDNRLALVASGEEVTRTAMAVKYRPLLKAINADRVPKFLATLPRYANGGTVGGGSAGAMMPSFNVVVQSKGGIDLTEYIDVSISEYDGQQAQARTRGSRRY